MTTLPIRHLSARVPWHDNKWNGKTCCNVIDNSFCRILPRIDVNKDPDNEPTDRLIDESYAPPCLSEKGTFLSPHQNFRQLNHAWKNINSLFSEFEPGIYQHKPFSINAVPFLWMMKGKSNGKLPHFSERANQYKLDYRPDFEEEIDRKLGFEGNIWVQHPHNQQVLLDSFCDCLKEEVSLIFFYCKHTPLSEPNERIIVGVAKVRKNPGPILEYSYPKGYTGHHGHPWDRCVEHTLTDKNPDGFLLPYHELLECVATDKLELDLKEYTASAPDLKQFSYTSELVEHDTAIDALLNMAESLRKIGTVLGKKFTEELAWIDNEISKIWDMRGAFPGMGAVLSGAGMAEGNTIAWEVEKHIRAIDGDMLTTDPWQIFEESVITPDKHLKTKGKQLFSATVKLLWRTMLAKKKSFYKLLSRCHLTNDQASFVIQNYKDMLEDLTGNLYLLYEKTRFKAHGFSFDQIDKAMLPPEKIRLAFPVPDEAILEHDLDPRRVRACAVSELEAAAKSGHSLLAFDDLLTRLHEKATVEPFPINEDVLAAFAEEDFFQEEVGSVLQTKGNPIHFLKLQRLCAVKEVIRRSISLKHIIEKPYSISKDWLSIIKACPKFIPLDPRDPDFENEQKALAEKAEALRILTNYQFSVLIGPAGSGKTTLLEIFETLPEIIEGGVLKLAPTGKARVKLGHNAETVAQFLYPDRYDGETGTYYTNDSAPKSSRAANVIIDEASMLTEEQLAAVLDALGPTDRIILVGDYRQLPPIGTGRPFVDIVCEIRPKAFENEDIRSAPAYAELKQIRRQTIKGDARWDVSLSRCFSDEPAKEDLEVFNEIAAGKIKSKHLRLEKWYDSADFKELFNKILVEELDIDMADREKSFNRTIGAVDDGDYQYFNHDDAEKKIEEWQVISPVNGYAYGVKEINKSIQGNFRRGFVDLALNIKQEDSKRFPKRKIAKPKGSDNIVYGDKVINLKNSRWEAKQSIRPKEMKTSALNFFANGEIGVITGEFRGKDNHSKEEPRIEIAFSTQPGYSYVFFPNQLKEDGKYSFELAYAITVHKSQGSGFKKLFFVLPASSPILCRELLYTALTRQEDKIIILHQGDFREFIRFASTEASATARRFTDLFHLPEVKQINTKWYDSRYVNISERNEPMISKNEVIIANLLNKYKARISYAYEAKLTIENSGRSIKPDFTIDNLETRKRFYWEHLGMMSKTDYRGKWEKKLEGYLADGFVLHTEAGPGDDKILIITEENLRGGINSVELDRLIREVILDEVV